MSDLSGLDQSQLVGITGLNSSGVETDPIGASDNRLWVQTQNEAISTVITTNPTLRYNERFNSSSKIALNNTTYTTLLTYSGSGLYYALNLIFKNNNALIRLNIDGNQIFDNDSSEGVNLQTLYEFDAMKKDLGGAFFNMASAIEIKHELPYPIAYEANVTVSAKMSNVTPANDAEFGFLTITKET